MRCIELFLRPNFEYFRLFFIGETATPSGPGWPVWGLQPQIDRLGLQNYHGTHGLAMMPPFLNVMLNPTLLHITENMFALANNYSIHNLCSKPPRCPAQLRVVLNSNHWV